VIEVKDIGSGLKEDREGLKKLIAAVIRFCLDYRAIFKGKSHNCC